jgi:hypothetical protein
MKADDIQAFWQGVLAIQIQAALAMDDTNRVHRLLTTSLTKLKESRAEGRFKGTDLEEVADSLVSKMEARTNSPTTGHAVPPETTAPGVQ